MAVVGHVEWVQFAHVEHVPHAGEVLHARAMLEEPAGGGAVAAAQLAKLAGSSKLLTALGEDEHGHRSVTRLGELGVQVHASLRSEPTRTALTLLDDGGERTIVTVGERLEPRGEEDELWSALGQVDAIYFTAGDAAALRRARGAARVLVASPRAHLALGHGVGVDALVLSGNDEHERADAESLEGEAELLVWTEAERGGHYRTRSGASGRWAAAELPGEPVDSYGCGDSFAAGLTYGLGVGLALEDALALAARCGAACLTGRGPYEGQVGVR